MAVSIYCRMKKIIYCDAAVPEGAKKLAGLAAVRRYTAELLGLPYQVAEKRTVFLGYETENYLIAGAVPKEETAGRRWNRTLKKLKKRVQKREMQMGSAEADDAFLFCSWQEGTYPAELLVRYYEEQRRGVRAVWEAEQLIVLDGAGMENETLEKMTFLSQICGAYNYAVVLTQHPEEWEALAEHCCTEYGLPLRIAADEGVAFREKKTLVIDWGSERSRCLRKLPEGSVYMDFYRSASKRHAICVKCRKILYLSLCNALDTVLKDTV